MIGFLTRTFVPTRVLGTRLPLGTRLGLLDPLACVNRSQFRRLSAAGGGGARPDSGFILKPLFERPELPKGSQIYRTLSEELPEGRLVQELRLEIYKNPKVIIGKGVWASHVVGDHVINIARLPKTGNTYLEKAKAVAEEEGNHLSDEDKEKFKCWFRTIGNSYLSTWKFQLVKHSYFTTDMRILNYIRMTGNLMVKFLNEGSSYNIKAILADLGYFPGRFYDAQDMLHKVSDRLGISIYLIPRLVNNIPTLNYFCILTAARTWNVLYHPSYKLVTSGMILYPCL